MTRFFATFLAGFSEYTMQATQIVDAEDGVT
jgi:hypothetical protein